MDKKELPIKDNVDIEFEYKLLHFYDQIKPYLKFIIAGIVIIILTVIFIVYKNSQTQKRLEEASIYVYQIKQLIDKEKFEEAKKQIKFFRANFSDTSYIKLVNSFDVLIDKKQNKLKLENISKLKTSFSSNQIKGYFTEYEAYIISQKDKSSALSKLNNINQQHFNYLSSLSLKGLILKSLNKDDEARENLNQVKQLAKDKFPYFENLAKESL